MGSPSWDAMMKRLADLEGKVEALTRNNHYPGMSRKRDDELQQAIDVCGLDWVRTSVTLGETYTEAEQTKLSGIEALADVTDAANVEAAGALMKDGLTEWDEQASDPTTPASGKWVLYFKAGGLFLEDDAGAVTGPLVDASGSGGLTDAYADMTDGTTTASASGSDTFKFRTANALLSISVGSNDATHGDNLLLTVNEGSFDHANIQNIGTNTHAQIDTHIASTSNPHSVDAADIGSATTSASGCVELATQAEVDTGTDATRAVTPASLATIQTDVDANTAKVSNATHTGDVTGSTALTIADEAVTFAKMAHVATAKVLGRTTAGTGDVEALDLVEQSTGVSDAGKLMKLDTGGYIHPSLIETGSSITQTYSTTTTTHAAREATSMSDGTGGTAGAGMGQIFDTSASDQSSQLNDNFATIAEMHNELRNDQLNTAQLLNQLIDDLQVGKKPG